MTEADTTPGSQSALRQANERRVVDVLRRDGTRTQAELARATGLSAASVSNIVRGLRAAGTVAVRDTSSNGRRARAVSLLRPPGTVVAVDFAPGHVRVALGDSAGTMLSRESIAYDAAADAERAVRRAAWLAETLLLAARIDLGTVSSVVASVPAPLDPDTGEVGEISGLPRWTGFRPAQALEERLGVPVRVENDANLAVLAERESGAAQGADHIIHLVLGEGVGAGVVVSGELFRGAGGTAGEVGHIGLDPRGQVCRCGNRGCLETFVGSSYLLGMLPPHAGPLHGPGPVGVADLVDAALAGDPGCRRIIDEAGTALGQGAAIMANLFNPDRVVVGGELARADALLMVPMRRAMEMGALGSALRRLTLARSALGDQAILRGALRTAARLAG
ncbi:ROK family transcriptional regulator [Nocardiopsis sp. MG754419]|uniref:ROK family transcriptional regulator n=1 Tax=Nocardiopsis sp. MG754419 TaxID=2259865 RepID=UPI001BA5D1BF|nr:ROK family transcriptional regulator [Nocardiopsis sp. MG754419]MBR8744649.1 ROK family transcriptional regulator [Nocardiopsis sp. MG754419]